MVAKADIIKSLGAGNNVMQGTGLPRSLKDREKNKSKKGGKASNQQESNNQQSVYQIDYQTVAELTPSENPKLWWLRLSMGHQDHYYNQMVHTLENT